MTITVTRLLVADLGVEGERMPVYAYVIDHPDARVLVDTGIKELHPLTVDLDPRPRPTAEWGIDLSGIDVVVNTHLHFDHCGNNHLLAGTPTYVQQAELDDALSLDDYTIRDWVEAPNVRYLPVDGEHELLPVYDSSRRRDTRADRSSSWLKRVTARPCSPATRQSGSASSTIRRRKGSTSSSR